VLITHRLAGLESVDEIMVMDRGRVVERGPHDALLDLGGTYARLWWDEMSGSHTGIDCAPDHADDHIPQPQTTASDPRTERLDRSARR
jgi:ABC-type dipeptide/oligopeptide/nickel transport system ATPase component